MDYDSAPDLLSDLPMEIIETIFTLLPIREVVRTSILSSKWRYRWASLPYLVFDDNCANCPENKDINSLIKFVTRFLFLHKGPIQKFKLCASYLHNCPDIDQWLLFLSRKGIRDLTLNLRAPNGQHRGPNLPRMPSCLFSCRELTHLELRSCQLDLPPTFNGFLCLRRLILYDVLITRGAIENIVSSCPLLEDFRWVDFESLEISLHAPNLKYLCLVGKFKEVCLESSPLLAEIGIIMLPFGMVDGVQESAVHNFIKFLGGLSNLERLTGQLNFTKFLSVGIERLHALVFHHLKLLHLNLVSFGEIKEIQVVVRLLMSSPNLQELHIIGRCIDKTAPEASDTCLWDAVCPSDCTFKQLKVIKLNALIGLPYEMKFIKFMLGNSPALESMIIQSCERLEGAKGNMLTEAARFRRASPHAKISLGLFLRRCFHSIK